MVRRCSNCSVEGHSRRTCPMLKPVAGEGTWIMLFGVNLTDESSIKKSMSFGNLLHSSGSSSDLGNGYYSENGSAQVDRIRKKGTPWTEEEHMKFLLGMEKLGRGQWLGISKTYVPSKTATQVASHAQKHFMRQTDMAIKKRRTSLFDIVQYRETDSTSPPAEQLRAPSPTAFTDNEKLKEMDSLDLSLQPVVMPLPFQLWPSTTLYPVKDDDYQQKVIQSVPKQNGKEMVGMAQFTLYEPLFLSLSPPGGS